MTEMPRDKPFDVHDFTPGVSAGMGDAPFIFDGEAAIVPPRSLVKGLIPYDGIAFLGGQSGAGKTFVMCMLSTALASGTAFFGRKVCERVGVVIFAPEGVTTIPARVHVAREAVGIKEPLPIAWLGAVPNLADPEECKRMVPRLRDVDAGMRERFGVRLGAVFFDTLVASFNLDDEDDNSEAAKTIRRLKEIVDPIGAVAIPVHHYGKGAETGLRGASGWRAGCDAVLSVLATRNQITGKVSDRSIALAKSRVGEEGPISAFDLRFVRLGVDDDGEEFGACYVEPNADPVLYTSKAEERASRMSSGCKAYVDAFGAVFNEGHKVRPFGFEGPEVVAVDRETLRTEFYATWAADDAGAKRKAFGRAEREAIDRKVLASREVSGRQVVWRVDADISRPH